MRTGGRAHRHRVGASSVTIYLSSAGKSIASPQILARRCSRYLAIKTSPVWAWGSNVSTVASTASSSAYAATLSQLLVSSDSSATSSPVPGGETVAEALVDLVTGKSTDTINLSDQAKALLAQARANQLAANKLEAFSQSTQNNGRTQGPTAPSNAPLSSAGQRGNSTWDPNASIDNRGAYQQAQQAAHTRADGTIQSWSTSASDVFDVPSTPQEIDQWYQSTQGQQILALAQAFPGSMPGLAEALQNRTVTIADARDIPGLNFHNTVTFQGGEGGSGGSSRVSFNSSAPLFQDPNIRYEVMDNGTVITWKNPTGAGSATQTS